MTIFITFTNALQKILVILGLFFLSLGVLTTLPTHTQSNFSDPAACTDTKKITIADIFVTTSFTPLLDPACSSDANGRAQPLSLAVLPSILIRGYGFMASLVFYIFGINLIVAGLRWIYGGIGNNTERQIADAKRSIATSVTAIGLVLGAYLIVFTVLQVLGVESLGSTDVSSFFTF
jgi:hypothetical protein